MKYFIITMILFASCSRQSSNSETTLINGIREHKYPEVVKFDFIQENQNRACTGTFISHNILLTAAHCVSGATSIQYNGSFAIDTMHHPQFDDLFHKAQNPTNYVEKTMLFQPYDIAVIRFPDHTAPKTGQISKVPLAVGMMMTLVGYGIDGYIGVDINGKSVAADRNSAGYQKHGTVQYRGSANDQRLGIITTTGHAMNKVDSQGQQAPDGKDVSVGSGDSGGPMLIEGKGIIGIASTQLLTSNGNQSTHVDLHSPICKEFFAQVKKFYNLDIYAPAIEITPKTDEMPQTSEIKTSATFTQADRATVITISSIPKGLATKAEFYWQDSTSPFYDQAIGSEMTSLTTTQLFINNCKVTIKFVKADKYPANIDTIIMNID